MATVDLVLPVYDEERRLAVSARTLLAWCDAHPEHEWRVVVADHGSRDGTLAVALELEAEHPRRLVALHVPVVGRGRALRTAWLTSPAAVCVYVDVRLATDLGALPALVDPLAAGVVDLAAGSRLHPAAPRRGLLRLLRARAFALLLRQTLGLRVTDARCGLLAIRGGAARELLPRVRDTRELFDVELLLLAQRSGYRLREVPVHGSGQRRGRARIASTVLRDLRGVWRLRRGVAARTRRAPPEALQDRAA